MSVEKILEELMVDEDLLFPGIMNESELYESDLHPIGKVISSFAKTISKGQPREFDDHEKFLMQQFKHHLGKHANAEGKVSSEHVRKAYKQAVADHRTGAANATQLIQKTPELSRGGAGVWRENEYQDHIDLIYLAEDTFLNESEMKHKVRDRHVDTFDSIQAHVEKFDDMINNPHFTSTHEKLGADPVLLSHIKTHLRKLHGALGDAAVSTWHAGGDEYKSRKRPDDDLP